MANDGARARETMKAIEQLRRQWANYPPGECPKDWTHTGTEKIITAALAAASVEALEEAARLGYM
jgi:hypothetical protein